MKQADFRRRSSVLYIGRGLIIASVVITASVGFLLGFFVGKHVRPVPEAHTSDIAALREPDPGAQVPETKGIVTEQTTAAESPEQVNNDQRLQSQQAVESHATQPARKPSANHRDSGSPSSDARRDVSQPPVSPKTKHDQAAKLQQDAHQKKETGVSSEKKQPPSAADSRKYAVQVGAFKSPEEAEALKTRIGKKGYKVVVIPAKSKNHGLLHKVMVGEYKDRKEAELLSVKLKNTEDLRTFVTFLIQEGATRQQ